MKKQNELIILHPLQINCNRVRNLVNGTLDSLGDSDISRIHRLQIAVRDLTKALSELEKLRSNLCDFRSELQLVIQDLNEEDLPF